MSKMKQIAALTAMLVGVILYASPAKSAVCFLPDDDGSCGGGDIEISDNPTPENQCTDFKLSKNQRDSKEYSSDCYACEPCTYNNRTTYRCTLKNGATWYGNLGVCCTNGETYDSAEGQCCPAGGCTHECDAPKKWSTTLRSCECPNGKETSTGTCCADEEHVDGAICCPEKKHNEGGVCVCDSQYNTDKDGNCVLPVGCTYEYRQVTTEDSAGLTGNLDDGYKCTWNSDCWKKLYFAKSVATLSGTPAIMPVINKISNKSATCIDENNVTKYQTICEGTARSHCNENNNDFVPNGCVSDTYNNGFEVKGDEFGTCTKKEEKCFYEYTHLTYNDTGTTNYDGKQLRYGTDGDICSVEGARREITSSCINYNGSYKCGGPYGDECTPGQSCKIKQTCLITYNCFFRSKCYNAIINNPSIVGRFSGTPEWGTLYNKISNKSASCVTLQGVKKYETLCEGTIKEKCQSNQTFVPNGCVSDIYTDGGVYVSGANWGNCVCDTSKGLYDTAEECKKMTGKNCTSSYSCYTICESRGYYSTEAACLNGKSSRQVCSKHNYDDCYERKTTGFTITQSCSKINCDWSFSLITPDGQHASGNGVYDSGSYSVVIQHSSSNINYANVYSRQSGGGWCFGDQSTNTSCEKTESIASGRSTSKKHNFIDGMDYVVSVSYHQN